jgi:superfamily II RNA helicase
MALIIEPTIPLSDWSADECEAKTYPFELDNFQKRAIRAIHRDRNVFCLAMTGSGKTLLADYAIAHCLNHGKRVIFTSPIKALSNQKYKEFKDTYGESNVGIMTGDIKFNPDAKCLIMTAEILRNLLYKHESYTKNLGITSQLSLDDVQTVVMDEIHYINNDERGKVWEETLIMLPKSITLVLLSATIEHPEKLGQWLAQVRERDIHMMSNTVRVIPLTHYLYKPTSFSDLADPKLKEAALITLMTNEGKYNSSVYFNWTREYNKMLDKSLPKESDEYKKQENKNYSGNNRLNNLVEYLKFCGLCPAICFVFSRKNCEIYAKSIQDSLITGKEATEIEHIFHFYTHAYRTRLECLPQYYNILDLLKKGIAYHHSGLVPVLKEVIEIIFSKGFVKVLFATETFAVGLNMPTKTVVFLEYKKPDGNGIDKSNRMLYTDEYLQMAGRAGRRGKDTKGYVIYCPMRQPEPEEFVKNMMTGKKEPIRSKMDFGFEFIFKSLHSHIYSWNDIVVNSFWYQDQIRAMDAIKRENADILKRISDIVISEQEEEEVLLRHKYELSLKEDIHINIKDRQKRLDGWKNTHIGKKWDILYSQWKERNALRQKHDDNLADIEQFGDMDGFMRGYAMYLAEVGYLQNLPSNMLELTRDNLTEHGVLATEINEGHAILMVELYYYIREHSSEYTSLQILGYLTLFMRGDRLNRDDYELLTGPVIDYLSNKIINLGNMAEQYGICLTHDYWDLNHDWFYILHDWMEQKPIGEILGYHEIMEGNLTRGILKIVNLLEEWRNMATYLNDVAMLEKMTGLEEQLVRDVVIPDSLYIRT